MTLILSESDIDDAKKTGAKVRGECGAALRPLPVPEQKPSPEAPMRLLLGALREMTASIEAAITKRGDPAAVTLRPEIIVKPTVGGVEPVKPPRTWTIEVAERDKDRMMKKLIFTAGD